MKLRTGTAFVLMVCLIVFSVGFGAYRGWSRERAEVEEAAAGLHELLLSSSSHLEEALSRRIETANGLLTVALRHLPAGDERVQALTRDRDALADSTALDQKIEANDQFTRHAEALLEALAPLDSVQSNARDLAYVAQPGYLRTKLYDSEAQAGGDQLSQALTSFNSGVQEYNQAADAFNGELNGSFSGWVARLLGVKPVERIDDPTAVAFAVSSQPRYPKRPEGAVADDTVMRVLDDQTVADLNTLSDRLYEASGSRLYVAAVDFCNRASIESYAAELFRQWDLKERDALLMMAVGEGSRVLTGGEAALSILDRTTQERLLGGHFDSLYHALSYSRAAAELSVAAAQELAKPAALNVSGLFGTFAAPDLNDAAPAQQSNEAPDGEGSGLFDSFQDWADSVQQMNENQASARRFNWRGLLIWGLVIYFLFFRKKARKRR